MSHTPLSTNRQGDVIFNAKGIPVVCDEMYMPKHDMADRIVACVNACAGISTETLKQYGDGNLEALYKMRQQRDELQGHIDTIARAWKIWLSYRASSPEYKQKYLELSKAIADSKEVQS